MSQITEGSLLWEPNEEMIANANLTHYQQWLSDTHGLNFQDYAELWQWSVTDLDAFWESIWSYFNLKASKPAETILADRSMPVAAPTKASISGE